MNLNVSVPTTEATTNPPLGTVPSYQISQHERHPFQPDYESLSPNPACPPLPPLPKTVLIPVPSTPPPHLLHALSEAQGAGVLMKHLPLPLHLPLTLAETTGFHPIPIALVAPCLHLPPPIPTQPNPTSSQCPFTPIPDSEPRRLTAPSPFSCAPGPSACGWQSRWLLEPRPRP